MLSGPSATVIVGPERTVFTVPMALLFHFSDFAIKALTGHFREGAGNTILLPETDPRAFGLFVAYMYQGKLQIRDFCRRKSPAWMGDEYEALTDTCLLLCRFYVMVDFLQCRHWCRVQWEVVQQLKGVMNEAREMEMSTPMLPDTFLEVMRVIKRDSMLAMLILQDLRDEFAKMYRRRIADYENCAREFPEEFVQLFEQVVDGLQWGQYGIGPVSPPRLD